MLEIVVQANEIYHPAQNRFISLPSCVLTLEHSLISIAKWESKWHTPYLNAKKRSAEQELDYIRCMVIGSVKKRLCVFNTFRGEHRPDSKLYRQSNDGNHFFKKSSSLKKQRGGNGGNPILSDVYE